MSRNDVENNLYKDHPIRLEDGEKPVIPEEVPHNVRQKFVDLTYCLAAIVIYFVVVAISLGFVYLLYLCGEQSMPRIRQSDYRVKAHCNIPFISDQVLHYDVKNSKYYVEEPQFFGERFEIGLKDKPYVKIFVEEFLYSKTSIFIHDFLSNHTGIISHQDGVCFVLPLDPKSVMYPEQLLKHLKSVATGDNNLLQINTINMSVQFPKLNHFYNLGEHIVKECKGYPIFKLQPASNNTQLVLDRVIKYSFYGGFNVISYGISDMRIDDNLPRKKKEVADRTQNRFKKHCLNMRNAAMEKAYSGNLFEKFDRKIEPNVKFLHEVPNVFFCKVA